MELIEKYVYAVTSKLPEEQREDIAKELKTLISDMVDEISGNSETEKIKQVLIELGNPSILAENYRESKRYLIGPKNYPQYIFVLKIVSIAIFIAVTIGTIVDWAFINDNTVINMFGNYVGSITMGLLQGLTWVTIIFAISEHNGVDFNKKSNEKKWDIDKLPPLPNKKAVISKAESIIGIVFISIFSVIFYFFPEIVAVYILNDGEYNVISLINMNQFNNYKTLILGIFIVGIIREMVKLIYGKWSIHLAIYYTILTVISMGLFIIFIANPNLWNPDFASELAEYFGEDLTFDLSNRIITNTIIKIVIVFTLIDIISIFYKGIKYDCMKNF